MQTDVTSANNSQQCWVLLADNVGSVCMGLKESILPQALTSLIWYSGSKNILTTKRRFILRPLVFSLFSMVSTICRFVLCSNTIKTGFFWVIWKTDDLNTKKSNFTEQIKKNIRLFCAKLHCEPKTRHFWVWQQHVWNFLTIRRLNIAGSGIAMKHAWRYK